MSEPKRSSTLAAILDSTPWDYTPGRDGRLLLAPLERLFASVSWEFKPQHIGITPGRRRPKADRSDDRGFDPRIEAAITERRGDRSE